ncbi:protein of unknown function [uncultured Sphingopyxis sp.]|uniref:Uncharacterized protein n=1 Tax=uncultured Sphingopyxis sp. TaxID=310581 RepID=A0A1Y5PWG5_9SPHN|nr:protein of unknown function [uncultured Sphingopyxis sp.]
MRAGLQEIEVGGHRRIAASHHHGRGNRRAAPVGNIDARRVEKQGGGEDRGHDRQRVYAGIEDAEAAGVEDPFLPRMPAADIFLPPDMRRANPLVAQPVARRGDPRRLARMPGREQGDAARAGVNGERADLGRGRGGRLFEHDMQSRVDRRRRDRVAADRRSADRHGVEAMVARDHRGDVGMSRHAIELRVAAGGRDKRVSIVRMDGGKMLVARDFSDSDQSQANHHSSSYFYLSDIYASYLRRFRLSTDSGLGPKMCIEKDIYGRRGENAARRQGRAAVACLVRQSG